MIVLNMVVRNEERRIGVMLAMTLPLVDGAVIVDQSSTDSTAVMCRSFGATVIADEHRGYCEPSRRLAQEATPDGSWILVLDADEFLLPQFSREMHKLDRFYDGAMLRFSHWISGEHQGDGDPHYRFARKSHMVMPEGIHKAPEPTPEARVYCPEYPAIMHVKTWEEQLESEASYKQVLSKTPVEDHEHVLECSTRNLEMARRQGLSGHDIDTMTIAQRHIHQFGRWK